MSADKNWLYTSSKDGIIYCCLIDEFIECNLVTNYRGSSTDIKDISSENVLESKIN